MLNPHLDVGPPQGPTQASHIGAAFIEEQDDIVLPEGIVHRILLLPYECYPMGPFATYVITSRERPRTS